MSIIVVEIRATSRETGAPSARGGRCGTGPSSGSRTIRLPAVASPVHHRTGRDAGSDRIPDSDVDERRQDELAIKLARWEASVQRSDGSLAAPDNVPYTFEWRRLCVASWPCSIVRHTSSRTFAGHVITC